MEPRCRMYVGALADADDINIVVSNCFWATENVKYLPGLCQEPQSGTTTVILLNSDTEQRVVHVVSWRQCYSV